MRVWPCLRATSDDEVLERLGHRGAARPAHRLGEVGGGPPGVERPAHRLGREAVDGGAAAGLDVGGEAHERPEAADERPGGDGGEVGLDEDVVDGGGQVRRHGGRHVVDRVGGGEQRAAGLGQRPAAGHAEPVGLAKDRLDGLVEHGSGPVGSAPGEALAERAVVGRAALLERGELAQHLAPDRPDRRPLDVRAEGVGGPGAGAPTPDEVGCAGRAEPGEGQRRPPVPGLARAPLVDLRRGSPHRHDLAVVGDEARRHTPARRRRRCARGRGRAPAG